jgi:hypothetical protein
MSRISKMPFHPLLFSIYPVLALLAVNIHEVSPSVLWRPLEIVFLGTGIGLLLLWLILRDWGKVSLITSFIVTLVFSYGRFYEYLKTTPLAEAGVVRHRFLVILFSVVLIVGIWFILKRIRDIKPVTGFLNLISIILVAFPVVQIGTYLLNTSSGERAVEEWTPGTSLLPLDTQAGKPDVYYIILDTYARSDRIKAELGFDNSGFISRLEEMGFYIASCSRSNYNNTHNSIVSSLNMSYLPELYEQGAAQGISIPDIWMLIKPNAVRRNFEALGYKIVAFDTGFEWTRIDDADLYLERGADAYGVQLVNPFEQMLIDTTPLKVYTDYRSKFNLDKYLGGTHPQANFIGLEEFILDELPKLAAISETTFTFAHIDIPHPPYVFSPDGYLTDPGYWSVPVKGAVDEEHFRSGYIYAVEYINARMLSIISEILDNSNVPPIIIIQGDHGFGEGDNFPILNAYYLPGVDPAVLYPTISPVNSFRLVFDEFFDGNLILFQDESYFVTDVTTPIPESLPDCIVNH